MATIVGTSIFAGWLTRKRLRTSSLWPYALTLTVAVCVTFVALVRAGVIRPDA